MIKTVIFCSIILLVFFFALYFTNNTFKTVEKPDTGTKIDTNEFSDKTDENTDRGEKFDTDEFSSAIYCGNFGKVEELIKKYPQCINSKDNSFCPLHLAVEEGQKNIVELLVTSGCDINRKDMSGMTPLHIAATLPPVQSAYSMEMIDVVREDRYEKENKLIPIPPKPSEPPSNEPDNNPLLKKENQLEMAKFLISKGADVNTVDMSGQAPLQMAVCCCFIEMIELLISEGADINTGDVNGNTPLHNTESEEISALLIEHGADLTSRNNIGETPLMSALFCPFDGGERAKFLIEKGADVNVENNSGWTPLAMAAYWALPVELVKFLVDKGADVNSRDSSGQTPLHLAVTSDYQGDNKEVIAFLISKGSDVNAKDNKDNTPLHIAIQGDRQGNHRNIEEFLLQKGADVNARDSKGRTPLDLAKSEKCDAVINLLKEYGGEGGGKI